MQLFKEIDFENFTNSTINAAIKDIKHSQILKVDIITEAEKILKNLSFSIPVIKTVDISSKITLEDNEKTKDPIDSFAVATFIIPFNGNAQMFYIAPKQGALKCEQKIEVSKNELKFRIKTDANSIELPDVWKAFIIERSKDIVGKIQTNLSALTTDFLELKSNLLPLIIKMLNLKKEEALKLKSAEDSINIFKDN